MTYKYLGLRTEGQNSIDGPLATDLQDYFAKLAFPKAEGI